MKRSLFVLGALCMALAAVGPWAAQAQVLSPVPSTPVQLMPGFYAVTPISATAAANAQATLTIPAPPAGMYNYICALSFNYNQTATTGTVQTNAVTTSTNFNSFALKFSAAAAINTTYEWANNWGTPATGCPKSTAPATATTFVSPAAATNGAFTWEAVYFQAP